MEIDAMVDDDQNDKAIEFFHHTLKAKVDAMVRQGFEGWVGTLTSSFGYELVVKLDMKRRP